MSDNVTIISGKKLVISDTIVIRPGIDVEKIFVNAEPRALGVKWNLEDVKHISLKRPSFLKRVWRKIESWL
ncbi:hypothetical protein PP940_gp197 [Rhizobium phage RL2RES]|uniref:Uncharacterized protein n=1 Tax=Rhizobium phage RL2RES TaxID=103371 RepID=A0A6B9JDM3_9CAUD|nr:hypothetical protein PP940_gp197 [Rhizobium phage RL2RES]QGZ14326.1 hypothetical protein RL2RES_197 [Rhizobium phage RL2RES]